MRIELKRYHIVLLLALAGTIFYALFFSQKKPDADANIVMEEKPVQTAVKTLLTEKNKPEVPRRNNSVKIMTLAGEVSKPSKEQGKVATGISPTWTGTDMKRIAFTFDDGPHPKLTDRLLELLDKENVKATFFVVGKQAEHYPELIQRIFEHGHELANHTYTHRNLSRLSHLEFDHELDQTHRIVQAITDQPMKFFRPPGGQYDGQVVARANDLGYRMVMWNIAPGDHANPPAELIKTRVLRNLHENGVVLLHSGIENTLAALPELITELRRRGYTFMTVSQMMDAGGMNLARKPDSAPQTKIRP